MGWVTVTLFLYSLALYGMGIYAYYVYYPPSFDWHIMTGVSAMLILACILIVQWSVKFGYLVAAGVLIFVLAYCIARYFWQYGETFPGIPVFIGTSIMVAALAIAHKQNQRREKAREEQDEQ
jgi:Kef-type K+ transport system membrane component KefB